MDLRRRDQRPGIVGVQVDREVGMQSRFRGAAGQLTRPSYAELGARILRVEVRRALRQLQRCRVLLEVTEHSGKDDMLRVLELYHAAERRREVGCLLGEKLEEAL